MATSLLLCLRWIHTSWLRSIRELRVDLLPKGIIPATKRKVIVIRDWIQLMSQSEMCAFRDLQSMAIALGKDWRPFQKGLPPHFWRRQVPAWGEWTLKWQDATEDYLLRWSEWHLAKGLFSLEGEWRPAARPTCDRCKKPKNDMTWCRLCRELVCNSCWEKHHSHWPPQCLQTFCIAQNAHVKVTPNPRVSDPSKVAAISPKNGKATWSPSLPPRPTTAPRGWPQTAEQQKRKSRR